MGWFVCLLFEFLCCVDKANCNSHLTIFTQAHQTTQPMESVCRSPLVRSLRDEEPLTSNQRQRTNQWVDVLYLELMWLRAPPLQFWESGISINPIYLNDLWEKAFQFLLPLKRKFMPLFHGKDEVGHEDEGWGKSSVTWFSAHSHARVLALCQAVPSAFMRLAHWILTTTLRGWTSCLQMILDLYIVSERTQDQESPFSLSDNRDQVLTTLL